MMRKVGIFYVLIENAYVAMLLLTPAALIYLGIAVSSEPADKIKYFVDKGPPVRVAFPKDGIIDNWSGVIYDPSDAVGQVFTASPEIRKLFGGDD